MNPIQEAVRNYLGEQNVTLWGDYDLTRPDRFDKAVDWLTDQVRGVLVHTRQGGFVETIVTESGKTITVERPPLPFPTVGPPILPRKLTHEAPYRSPFKVTVDPYRVDL